MGGLSPTTHAIARNGSRCSARFPKRNLTRSDREAEGTRADARGAEGARAIAGTEPAHDHGMINRMACPRESPRARMGLIRGIVRLQLRSMASLASRVSASQAGLIATARSLTDAVANL